MPSLFSLQNKIYGLGARFTFGLSSLGALTLASDFFAALGAIVKVVLKNEVFENGRSGAWHSDYYVAALTQKQREKRLNPECAEISIMQLTLLKYKYTFKMYINWVHFIILTVGFFEI